MSLLRLARLIKESQSDPSILQSASITSSYRGKGEKSDPSNQRGVVNLIKAHSIIDRHIYSDIYQVIDSSMSCSNIDARKNPNIRDHLFVLYSALFKVSKSEHLIDLQIFDVQKCFDEM